MENMHGGKSKAQSQQHDLLLQWWQVQQMQHS